MTTSRAQHASAPTPRAPTHVGAEGRVPLRAPPAGRGGLLALASGAGLAAVWAASWIFLALAVAAPAGRMHAASVHAEPVRRAPAAGGTLASVHPAAADAIAASKP
jgi:hypothetical protein